MSRIGKLPINIPGGVTITVGDDNTVVVKGPKGELSEKISPKMHVSMDNGVLHVTRPDDIKENRALHGLSRSLINNMVVGVTHGYSKSLEIVGVGYRAQKQGNKLVLNLGYSHPVEFEEPKGITLMPTISSTARAGPPAITPVPSSAGSMRTWPLPNLPSTA